MILQSLFRAAALLFAPLFHKEVKPVAEKTEEEIPPLRWNSNQQFLKPIEASPQSVMELLKKKNAPPEFLKMAGMMQRGIDDAARLDKAISDGDMTVLSGDLAGEERQYMRNIAAQLHQKDKEPSEGL